MEEAALPHKDAFIRVYFNTVHSSFPVLDPVQFDPNSSSTLVLAAMYALSHKFCLETGQVDPWIFLDFIGRPKIGTRNWRVLRLVYFTRSVIRISFGETHEI